LVAGKICMRYWPAIAQARWVIVVLVAKLGGENAGAWRLYKYSARLCPEQEISIIKVFISLVLS